ncbi:MAG: hypothetical protein ACMUJM_12835 [bacterium]
MKERRSHLLLGSLIFLLATFFIGATCNAQLPIPFNPFLFPYYPIIDQAYIPPLSVAPNTITASVIPPAPIAFIAQSSTTVFTPPVTTIAGVIIADFIINTGNPQVKSVLLLIAADPSLLDNPFLLSLLINTGNPDVIAALAWLASVL